MGSEFVPLGGIMSNLRSATVDTQWNAWETSTYLAFVGGLPLLVLWLPPLFHDNPLIVAHETSRYRHCYWALTGTHWKHSQDKKYRRTLTGDSDYFSSRQFQYSFNRHWNTVGNTPYDRCR